MRATREPRRGDRSGGGDAELSLPAAVDIQVVPAPDDLAYRVDAHARITFVNDRWDVFARDNGAPELAGAAVIGRLMSEFISGAETWHLYRLLTQHAQRVRRPFTLFFRCDAPHAQRFMQMRISALSDGQIEFHSHALEIRPRTAMALLTAGAGRDPSRAAAHLQLVQPRRSEPPVDGDRPGGEDARPVRGAAAAAPDPRRVRRVPCTSRGGVPLGMLIRSV